MIRNREIIPLTWVIGYSGEKDKSPEEFVTAKVPGGAQLDIAAAKGYPDYRVGDNFRLFKWMENVFFTYRADFRKMPEYDGKEVWFVTKGIDYAYEIRLNGRTILKKEGMFSPSEVRITDMLLEENRLEVIIDRIPVREGMPEDRSQASACVKPASSYGWDWHPRLVPSGIWDETGLQVRPKASISDISVTYDLNEDMTIADVHVAAVCDGISGEDMINVSIIDMEGDIVCTGKVPASEGKVGLTVRNPDLWWCHDHGTPYLYEVKTSLVTGSMQKECDEDNDAECGYTVESYSRHIGFRRVRLVMNAGAWNKPEGFPKSRSAAPAQIELNGRRIFAKGTNWVSPEIFPGRITDERYRLLLNLVLEANFNIIRCWGGCIVNKDSFFEICDRAGILVWQEFPLACNCYPDDRKYLDILEQEAVAIISRLREHPCISIWCGGNELFNSWSGMTDQSLALRMLNSLCLSLAPDIPFIPTSPLEGMGHGNYLFRWEGKDIFQMMGSSSCTAYCEFGIPSLSPIRVLKGIIPENDFFPPAAGTAWETHHAFGAWDGDHDTWLGENVISFYFGPSKDIEELYERSSLLQCEGYKAIFEEARRQKPHCSMALNWCFNEPWPTAANNSIISYPNICKPAFHEISKACRPICASARFSKFQWMEGEPLDCGLWILNDSPSRVEALEIDVFISCREDRRHLLHWECPSSGPDENIIGPVIRTVLPEWDGCSIFTIEISVKGHPEMNSEYRLAYRKRPGRTNVTAAMNRTPDTF